VCFLAQKYGLTPREVALIALINLGKSGRAISQTLGIGMPTIREYCRRIHGKIGTHSRLAIGLWAIRNGMVKARNNINPGIPCTELLQGMSGHENPICSRRVSVARHGLPNVRDCVDHSDAVITP
jgi:DNA-binding CsgD family transcriptional regulator